MKKESSFKDLSEREVAELCAEEDKPELKLSDMDGNAFSILGRATRVAIRAGWSKEKISEFQKKATSGDYDHVLQTCMDYFDVV